MPICWYTSVPSRRFSALTYLILSRPNIRRPAFSPSPAPADALQIARGHVRALPALREPFAVIVEAQSVAVDTVSGATNTSNAILTAVTAAIEQAGADVAQLHSIPELMTSNAASSTGDGMLMAQVIGAALEGMENIQIHPVELGNAYKADTLEELAAPAGIDAAGLTAEVAHYNEMVDAVAGVDFGKKAVELRIEEAPFYCVPLSPTIHHTMGGLRIDTDTHGYNEAGEVIDGLYAAGEVTGGIHGSNRIGGSAITDIIVYGRIVGANALADQ